jgi:5-methyltetrahydrofolate--homocysteine methyltransferase
VTDTVISSATREVVIGFDRPFVIIGERINPTGRKILAAEMLAGDYSRVIADALAQVEAGAHMLDVNAGIPLADEPALLAKAIELVQSVTDVPLSIDSSIVAALEAGLAVYKGKALVNSVTGEEDRLETVLPLVKKYGAAVVAISNDETGISQDPDVRFAVAKKIVERACRLRYPGQRHRGRSAGDAHRCHQPGRRAGHGAGAPAAHRTQGQYHLWRVQCEFWPARAQWHQCRFPDHGDGAGMTSAITNPLHEEVVRPAWAPT